MILGEGAKNVGGRKSCDCKYIETKRILLARYGDTNRIVQAHLDFLKGLPLAKSATPDKLNITFIKCHRRTQAVWALGEDVNGYSKMLIPKILRTFLPKICQRWIVHVKRRGLLEGDILKLMLFLGKEVVGALTTQKIRGETLDHPNYIPSVAALHVNSKQSKSGRKDRHTWDPFCVFCESKGHGAQECKKVTEVSKQREKLKSVHRCFLCFNWGHNARVYSKKGKALCTGCKGVHHRSICNETRAISTPTKAASTTVGKMGIASPGFTYLQTLCIWVMGPTGLSKLTRCVLDTGSQSSFIVKTSRDDLKLEVVDRQDLVVSAFESRSSDPRRVAHFCTKSIWKNTTIPITAFESTHAPCPHPTVPHDITIMAQTSKIQLADPREGERDLPIEVLIGGDHYWRIVKDASTIRLSSSLVLLPTKFSWILTGNRTGITAHQMMVIT